MDKRSCMQCTEIHQADIIVAFYRQLADRLGDRGIAIFRKASEIYGENRGRRMALKVLRDGNALDFDSYFAYGELICQPELNIDEVTAEPGLVKEVALRCPWSEEFLAKNSKDCGNTYCRLIDTALVRGFNPALRIEVLRNMHDEGRCVFLYRDSAIHEGTLDAQERLFRPGQNEKRPMEVHCAELYHIYCNTVEMTLGEDASTVIEGARAFLSDMYGQEFLDSMDSYAGFDFSQI